MVFVISWEWAALVLATCYAGFLTAMITSPTLYRTVRNAEDLVNQDEFTPLLDEWMGILDYMKSSPPGSTWRRIVDRARGPSININDVMH